MRLFMDARYIRTDFHDGISRFSASLINATAPLTDTTVIINDPAQLDQLSVDVPWVKIHAPTSALEPLTARRLNTYRPDIVFSPMQTIGATGRQFGLIKTLHDLIYYQHRTPPKNLPQVIRGLWYVYHMSYAPQRLLLNSADAVATVSHTTKDLMVQHRLTHKPIEVISNAPQPVDTPRDPNHAPERSFVYMGSFMAYKNIELLIKALKYLPNFTLHLLSRIDENREAELQALASEWAHPTSEVKFHRGVGDDKYRQQVRSATALVTMSQAEGYGLPVAEAMAEGTPVVVSELPIFREIAGDHDGAAQFINTEDSEAPQNLAHALLRLQDPATFAQASKAAAQQSRRYDWNDSAQALIEMGHRVMASRRG